MKVVCASVLIGNDDKELEVGSCAGALVGDSDILGADDRCSVPRNGLIAVVPARAARGSKLGGRPTAAALIAAAVAALTTGIWDEMRAGLESSPFKNGVLVPNKLLGRDATATGFTRPAISASCCNDDIRPWKWPVYSAHSLISVLRKPDPRSSNWRRNEVDDSHSQVRVALMRIWIKQQFNGKNQNSAFPLQAQWTPVK